MKKTLKTWLTAVLTIAITVTTTAVKAQKRVLTYDIMDEINNTAWVHTQKAFEQADEDKSDCIIIHMNTYGGEVVYADSIRTKILNSQKPVYVFIDNNAASAGSLISIACDSIYMRKGANIGAASVVDQSGEKMPDKYQSYMRSTMRSTAESHGMRSDDTTRWMRDPRIAEAMVDEFVAIAGVVDSGKILTFTTEEAIKHGYCEGKMTTIEEVAHHVAGNNCVITAYNPTLKDDLKGWLGSTALRGILVLIIIGGIYFEMQTPGMGFPSVAAVVAAILFFAPLWIDGLAATWEIWLFVLGIVLLAAEIFVVPGFGLTGIAGIVCIVISLTLSLINNDGLDFSMVGRGEIARAFAFVITTFVIGLSGVLIATNYYFAGERLKKSVVVLGTDQEGYVGTDMTASTMIGKEALAKTDLRPSGKIEVEGETLDALSEGGYIEKGSKVIIKDATESQAIVRKLV